MYKILSLIWVFLFFVIQANAMTLEEISAELKKMGSTSETVLYDNVSNVLVLRNNGKYGIMYFPNDTDISIIRNMNYEYDKIERIAHKPPSENNERIYFKIIKNNKTGLFIVDKPIIAPLYDNIEVSYEKEDNGFHDEIFIVTQGTKKGALEYNNNNYNFIIPVQYDNIDYLKYGLNAKYIEVTQNGKKGVFIVSYYGNYLAIPTYFDELEIKNPPYISVKQYGKFGMFHDNRQVVPIKYDNVESIGAYVIVTLNNQQGAYNDDGILVVPAGYDEVIYAENSLDPPYVDEASFIVRKGNRYGVHGKIPVEFDDIEQIYRGYIVKKNNKYGLYHLTKGRLLKPEYDKIYIQDAEKVVAEKNGKVTKTINMDIKSVHEKAMDVFMYTCFFWLIIPLKGLP